MKVSLNWLREYVDIEIPPDELGQLLTMAGLEMEGIEAVGQSLEDVVVARVVTVEPHPKADRLSLCQVDIGRESVPVICGAPNVKNDILVPLALPGARLPTRSAIPRISAR